MPNPTAEGDTQKKFIEVTSEDYETALATKVINKAYKLVLGVVIVVLALLAFFGFKYNQDITQANTELVQKQNALDSLELAYQKAQFKINTTVNAMKSQLEQFEDARSFFTGYYDKIDNTYRSSTGLLFSSYVGATQENLRLMARLEDSVEVKLTQLKDSVGGRLEESDNTLISLTDRLEDAQDALGLLTPDTLEYFLKNFEKKREKIFAEMEKEEKKYYGYQVTLVKNSVAYNYNLQAPIEYRDKTLGPPKIILFGESYTSDDNLPKEVEIDGEKYRLIWDGNLGDQEITLDITKL